MSVHVHYLRKIQINGLGFDSVFLCGTFGMSIMAKYTWLNKIQLTALVNCSGNPKMISYMSTKSFFFLLNVEFKQTTQHILKNNGHQQEMAMYLPVYQ